MSADQRFAAVPTDDLLDAIARTGFGMPVRRMEAVLARGSAAAGPAVAALARARDDDARDPLWLIVLLGELRDPAAIGALIDHLRRPDLDLLAEASAEALAKIGAPAVPALLALARDGEPGERLWAYVALGWIDDDRARAALRGALSSDRELGMVIALALGSHSRRDDVDAILAAYRTCEPSERGDFEEAVRCAALGAPPPRWTRDWRLRYRRRPDLDRGIELEWSAVLSVVRSADVAPEGGEPPLRDLNAILAAAPEEPERCDDCGDPIERPMAVPLCPDTAVAVALDQLAVVESARDDGIDDVFELLDELEAEEEELRARRVPRRGRAREELEEQLWDMAEARATCEWLVEQGVEDVAEGAALIESQVRELAQRHGDPDRLLGVPVPVTRTEKVGRNDPCPCGSGRKYKRCCLDKA